MLIIVETIVDYSFFQIYLSRILISSKVMQMRFEYVVNQLNYVFLNLFYVITNLMSASRQNMNIWDSFYHILDNQTTAIINLRR